MRTFTTVGVDTETKAELKRLAGNRTMTDYVRGLVQGDAAINERIRQLELIAMRMDRRLREMDGRQMWLIQDAGRQNRELLKSIKEIVKSEAVALS